MCAVLLLTSCGPATSSTPSNVRGDPRVGLSLFRIEGCALCHAVAGIAVGETGPALDGEGGRRGAAWLTAFLPAHGALVKAPVLDASDRQDLVAYLASLTP